MPDYYYTKNDDILNSSLNKRFQDIHFMTDSEFEKWIKSFARLVKKIWDEKGIPFVAGKTEEEITNDFKRILKLDPTSQLVRDTATSQEDCIKNSIKINVADAFFPNILKAKDTIGKKQYSVYDLFTPDPACYELLYKTLHKALRKDSMRGFSKLDKSKGAKNITEKQIIPYLKAIEKTGDSYWFEANPKFLSAARVRRELIEKLIAEKKIDKKHELDLRKNRWEVSHHYYIRIMGDEKVFPNIVTIVKTGKISAPTNFQPVVAKYIYKRYTDSLRKQEQIVIYDPSMGFGGRLLGALALGDRRIHYVGTDPNTENWISEIDRSRYKVLEQTFNSRVSREKPFSGEYICCGSEDIGSQKTFKKYKGKLDLVFTSPPYFSAEIYSDEETQSSIRYKTYDDWRDNYWAKTIRTCVTYLKPKRYMIFNIADVELNGRQLPLEEDTIEIAKSLNMKYRKRLKMVVSSAPGAGRKKGGNLTTMNFCEVNGALRKYEPILVFYKP